MKKKYALILTVLLSQTAPLWSMEIIEENEHQHQHQQIITKLKKDIEYINKNINIDEKSKKVIILGPTRTGKSVLLNYLAEKNLIAKKNKMGPLYLEVESPLEGSKVGYGIESATTLPFSWKDQENNIDYWDCPGFGATNGAAQEIVDAFAIHYLCKGPTKIVLATSEKTLGDEMGDVLRFFQKIAKAFPQSKIEKYEGFSFILTKKRDIEIEESLDVLLENKENENIVLLQNEDVRDLIQYLKNKKVFASFPYPEKEGLYSNEHRVKILEIINQTKFVTRSVVNPSISSEMQLLAGKLVVQLNKDIKLSLEKDVAARLMDCCIRKVDLYSNPLKNGNQLLTFLKEFKEGLEIIKKENTNHFFAKLEEFFDTRRKDENQFYLEKDKDLVLKIKNDLENIKFLQAIDSNVTFNMDGWLVALQPTLDKVTNFFYKPEVFYQKAYSKNISPNASKALGILHESGTFIPKDIVSAVKYYKEAGDKGLVPVKVKVGFLYLNGASDGIRTIAKNGEEAFIWFEKAAKENHIPSQYNLAVMYEVGTGVPKNLKKAEKWYLKAANQGHDISQYNLAVMYENGTQLAKDLKKAEEWYQKAALQGYAPAQHNLGHMYEQETGVNKNLSTAEEWYQKAAHQGYAPAQHNLGFMYERGTGVIKNLLTAAEWYTKAANQGYAPAQHNLGLLYEQGEGVNKNLSTAAEWYQKAAGQGHSSAQYNLAILYENGTGVVKNLVTASEWYTKAAHQNHVHAQYNLAIMHETGAGVVLNPSQAAIWYQKAADQGYAFAQYNLAILYENGVGVNKDCKEAIQYYLKAADQNLVEAQISLGRLYIAEKNSEEALKWFEIAAKAGHIDAQCILGDLHNKGGIIFKNDELALKWYKMAAEKNHPLAQHEIGIMCLEGRIMQKNINEAINWFKKAAEQDLVVANLKLGNIYLNGEGVTKSESEAFKWFEKASQKGHNGAKKILLFLNK